MIKPQIVGILNLTPDSFSDGGNYMTETQILKQVENLIGNGASIIDIGAESTRPGATYVSAKDEIQRLQGVIKLIKNNYDVKISLDTYKPEVAKYGIEAGVDIINDVKASMCNYQMLDVIIEYKVPYIAMNYDPQLKELDLQPNELCDYVLNSFEAVIEYLKKHNYDLNKLILDPGIGFYKTAQQSLLLIQNLQYLRANTKYQLLLGASRKSSLGVASGIEDAQKRDVPTLITSILAMQSGIDYVRVHNAQMTNEGFKTLGAIDELS